MSIYFEQMEYLFEQGKKIGQLKKGAEFSDFKKQNKKRDYDEIYRDCGSPDDFVKQAVEEGYDQEEASEAYNEIQWKYREQ